METTENLKIVQRLLELAKNELEYSTYPKPFKEEHIFLPNVLNSALKDLENEFSEKFKRCVGAYKSTLKEQKKGYGWFHSPENLIYINMKINQLKWVVYGDRFVREIRFNEELGNKAYKDLIDQIDCTVLMSETKRKAHAKKCNEMAIRIVNEILEKEKV